MFTHRQTDQLRLKVVFRASVCVCVGWTSLKNWGESWKLNRLNRKRTREKQRKRIESLSSVLPPSINPPKFHEWTGQMNWISQWIRMSEGFCWVNPCVKMTIPCCVHGNEIPKSSPVQMDSHLLQHRQVKVSFFLSSLFGCPLGTLDQSNGNDPMLLWWLGYETIPTIMAVKTTLSQPKMIVNLFSVSRMKTEGRQDIIECKHPPTKQAN